jgi:hypothetical protein
MPNTLVDATLGNKQAKPSLFAAITLAVYLVVFVLVILDV